MENQINLIKLPLHEIRQQGMDMHSIIQKNTTNPLSISPFENLYGKISHKMKDREVPLRSAIIFFLRQEFGSNTVVKDIAVVFGINHTTVSNITSNHSEYLEKNRDYREIGQTQGEQR